MTQFDSAEDDRNGGVSEIRRLRRMMSSLRGPRRVGGAMVELGRS